MSVRQKASQGSHILFSMSWVLLEVRTPRVGLSEWECHFLMCPSLAQAGLELVILLHQPLK